MSSGSRNYVEDIRGSVDGVPFLDNIVVAIYRWMLLAGFVLLPSAFSELQKDEHQSWITDISHVVGSIALVGWIIADLSVIGLIYYWWKWSNHHVWLLEQIFIPTFFDSLAGILSAIISVYEGDWSFSSANISALIVAIGSMFVCGILAFCYSVSISGKRHIHLVRQFFGGGHTSEYEELLIEDQEKSLFAMWLPRFFTWMLLAGFVILPVTYETELVTDEQLLESHRQLYISAWVVAGLGLLGLSVLALKWMHNCIYLLNTILFPALDHSIAGLLTTILALYLQHKGVFTSASRTTLIVTGTVSSVCLVLTVWCYFVKAGKQNDGHDPRHQGQYRLPPQQQPSFGGPYNAVPPGGYYPQGPWPAQPSQYY